MLHRRTLMFLAAALVGIGLTAGIACVQDGGEIRFDGVPLPQDPASTTRDFLSHLGWTA